MGQCFFIRRYIIRSHWIVTVSQTLRNSLSGETDPLDDAAAFYMKNLMPKKVDGSHFCNILSMQSRAACRISNVKNSIKNSVRLNFVRSLRYCIFACWQKNTATALYLLKCERDSNKNRNLTWPYWQILKTLHIHPQFYVAALLTDLNCTQKKYVML